jgi:hypothetical protein
MMRAFVLGVIVAVGLAVAAAFLLNDFVQKPASVAFSTPAARVSG